MSTILAPTIAPGGLAMSTRRGRYPCLVHRLEAERPGQHYRYLWRCGAVTVAAQPAELGDGPSCGACGVPPVTFASDDGPAIEGPSLDDVTGLLRYAVHRHQHIANACAEALTILDREPPAVVIFS